MTLKWEASPFKNPLARSRGLGSTGKGFDHWWMQRVTAFSNFFLMIWAVCAVIGLIGSDYAAFTLWLAEPVHAILLSLFIVSTFTHAALGLQVVIEDYVHCELSKAISLIALRLVMTGLAVAALFSIIKIAI
ncbi:MAG: succinate dehydrogenase, hydrophobic membrane anchor protein [Micavibrio aeruginosavorus]|uniref:Succinate dehydrogenase hydrophobic membrane anchor subunit n=1 Tax=Micavibrio aeruginosavorus TaxID=349221 RepID=A0A2W5HSW0_9BACT|nr:MAG: succinate dehydrogenase, hydrophobic membrane anchor protein [Micavibrio aeruginosavorus]